MPFKILLRDVKESQKSIGTDKGLAKIGDPVVNLAYSIAKSLKLSQDSSNNRVYRTGNKVSKEVLSSALKLALMRNFAKTRADSHDMADSVEAIIAYAWLKDIITIDQMISFLAENLQGNLKDRKEEINAAIIAFKNLLLHVKKSLPIN